MKQEELSKLRDEMKSQDNAATAYPLYVVFDWEKVPTEERYSDEYEYVDIEEGVTVAKTKGELIEYAKSEQDPKSSPRTNFNAMMERELLDWLTRHNNGIPVRKIFYLKKEVFITAFFTRKAAQAFIDANHYHYKEPHIYVATLWRNYEMQGIRDAIIERKFEIAGGEK